MGARTHRMSFWERSHKVLILLWDSSQRKEIGGIEKNTSADPRVIE